MQKFTGFNTILIPLWLLLLLAHNCPANSTRTHKEIEGKGPLSSQAAPKPEQQQKTEEDSIQEILEELESSLAEQHVEVQKVSLKVPGPPKELVEKAQELVKQLKEYVEMKSKVAAHTHGKNDLMDDLKVCEIKRKKVFHAYLDFVNLSTEMGIEYRYIEDHFAVVRHERSSPSFAHISFNERYTPLWPLFIELLNVYYNQLYPWPVV